MLPAINGFVTWRIRDLVTWRVGDLAMVKYVTVFALLGLAAPLSAQTAAAPLKLSVDEAVRMALQDNVDLATDRLDPQIGDTRVAAASGLFKPTIASSVKSTSSH